MLRAAPNQQDGNLPPLDDGSRLCGLPSTRRLQQHTESAGAFRNRPQDIRHTRRCRRHHWWPLRKPDDRNALLAIFGPDSKDLIFSGDDAAGQAERRSTSSTAYQTMNRWRKQTDGSEVLIVGPENNPFPIPLKKNSEGQMVLRHGRRQGRDSLAAHRRQRTGRDRRDGRDGGCPDANTSLNLTTA